MKQNPLFQSLDSKGMALSKDAQSLSSTLDLLTSAIVGRLITERLIEFGGQPGQTIEFLSICIADTILNKFGQLDSVEIDRYLQISDRAVRDE